VCDNWNGRHSIGHNWHNASQSEIACRPPAHQLLLTGLLRCCSCTPGGVEAYLKLRPVCNKITANAFKPSGRSTHHLKPKDCLSTRGRALSASRPPKQVVAIHVLFGPPNPHMQLHTMHCYGAGLSDQCGTVCPCVAGWQVPK